MSQVTVITGRDRRRKWGSEERRRVLEAVSEPGAVIAHVARQFDVATSMIYKWRHEACVSAAPLPVAITVEFLNGIRVLIDGAAPSALVTAALRALR
jgi:transposase